MRLFPQPSLTPCPSPLSVVGKALFTPATAEHPQEGICPAELGAVHATVVSSAPSTLPVVRKLDPVASSFPAQGQ